MRRKRILILGAAVAALFVGGFSDGGDSAKAQYIDPGGGLPPYFCSGATLGNVHYIPQRARLMQCAYSLAFEIPGNWYSDYGNVMGCLGGPNYPYGPCYLWRNY